MSDEGIENIKKRGLLVESPLCSVNGYLFLTNTFIFSNLLEIK
ncbi:hypothetical protein Bcell_1419 [Evansella cellulosilytica DSM 2522]|uniref:Uncharacterized protein n=1 Tax=Evansella cellulosilytica (strain ATCC 21833 / DSM 2522 / FERM P-1141 / JCM 9156 / N-4) TaxID=649639 RepID=E6TUC6_EVAC2|nr:hypothetical protein Bcell_1419 [Evansella cellulosilytica DSM 2522]